MALQLDLLIHGANVLYLFAYLVRDILWLRLLTVFAAIFLMAYFYLQPVPLMTPIYWNLVFTALNVFWIVRLALERRPVRLSAEEERLCELVFRTMSPREMIRILKLGSWRTAAAGECFLAKGQPLDRLIVIYSGRACVEVDGKYVTELQPGQFIGSISYITEESAPANIVALEPTRYYCWPKARLKAFMKKNPDLHTALPDHPGHRPDQVAARHLGTSERVNMRSRCSEKSIKLPVHPSPTPASSSHSRRL